MKKETFCILTLTSFFAGACSPSKYTKVPAPAWTKEVYVDVAKRSASVTTSSGQKFQMSGSLTAIGNGLSAYRKKRNLYIQDNNGVTCNWGMSDTLRSCYMLKPDSLR